ncbi:Lrp/AsnC family transcriptional regulator [Streptomyces sp. NBC_01537]|uniref:Lrp/AsnC family transcriptional regulator n=1 Tax=Streptomyces sp. NBC_01537 TaxID=2903896 RepID=UPI00386ED123
MKHIDAVDARILLALDDQPDATVLALSRTLGLARNTVHARLRRLTEDGTLKEFSRRLDPAAFGYTLTAFMSLSVRQTDASAALEGIRLVPEVIEAHSTTGDADLLAKVVARDTQDLHRITSEILEIDGMVRASTVISLLEVAPVRLTALLEIAAREAGR